MNQYRKKALSMIIAKASTVASERTVRTKVLWVMGIVGTSAKALLKAALTDRDYINLKRQPPNCC
jgi:hypothetical protein